ncbi:MAG: class I SAM-dependent methyltransferase [Alphaproteobacteria bacterium]|nr:class I SAM-dependent methyltransferase [Alphaproteobacteria bacterium]
MREVSEPPAFTHSPGAGGEPDYSLSAQLAGDVLWRPAVTEYPGQPDQVIVGGYCVVGPGRHRETLQLASDGASVSPNFIDNERLKAILAFLQGDCFHLHKPWPISGSRVVFQLRDRETGDIVEPFKFAVVPGKADFDRIPLPGKDRMRRVAGTADTPVKFLDGGCAAALQMDALLQATTGRRLNQFKSVLDWGVGCGRVARFVKERLVPSARLTGADIDDFNLEWCRENLPELRTLLFPLMPPTKARGSSFDLVYGLSVLTHLTESVQRAWFVELARLLKPGGIAYLTFNGLIAALYQGRSSSVLDSIQARGISDEMRDPALGEAMTGYYRVTFQAYPHVTAAVEPMFSVLAHYPHMFGVQDVLILERRRTG